MRNLRRVGKVDENPLEGVANLFDLGIVFALGFIVALMSYLGLPKVMRTVENGKGSGEKIKVEETKKLKNYEVSRKTLSGQGEKLGVAYRLKTGEVVYVPRGR